MVNKKKAFHPDGCTCFWGKFIEYLWKDFKNKKLSVEDLRILFGFYI
jgi:hypothetical protein